VSSPPLTLSLVEANKDFRFGSIEHLRPLIFGWAADLLIHSITIGAIVILVFGYLKLEGTGNSASEMKTGLDLVKAGGLVLLLVWVMIAAIVLASFTHRRALRGEKQVRLLLIPTGHQLTRS